jgi:hypothetical protein
VPGGSFTLLEKRKKIKMAMTEIMPSMAGLNRKKAIVFGFNMVPIGVKDRGLGGKKYLRESCNDKIFRSLST